RLVVIAAPDVVDTALALDQQPVHIWRGLADMAVARAHVAFLVSAEPDHAAARPADIASGKREVHQSAVGPVVVVAPDQPLLVSEHGAASCTVAFGLSDPFGGL